MANLHDDLTAAVEAAVQKENLKSSIHRRAKKAAGLGSKSLAMGVGNDVFGDTKAATQAYDAVQNLQESELEDQTERERQARARIQSNFLRGRYAK